jgi:hypothetical protein
VAEDLPDYQQNCNCYQRADDFSAVLETARFVAIFIFAVL